MVPIEGCLWGAGAPEDRAEEVADFFRVHRVEHPSADHSWYHQYSTQARPRVQPLSPAEQGRASGQAKLGYKTKSSVADLESGRTDPRQLD